MDKKSLTLLITLSGCLLIMIIFSISDSIAKTRQSRNLDKMWGIIKKQDSLLQVQENELVRNYGMITFQRKQIRNKIPSIEGSSRQRITGDMWFVDHSYKELYIKTDSSINKYEMVKISRQ